MNKKQILIIDDEEHILEMLRINMRTHGYDCITALSGEEGINLVRKLHPDLILLDVMLPGVDGVETCRILKNGEKTKRIPILMLSAKSQGQDKITGLKGGADDYITKPFSLQELFLRINAALRQVDLLTSDQKFIFSSGTLLLNSEKYQVISKGNKIDFTLTEFRILHLLIKQKNSIVSRQILHTEIFSKNYADGGRAIDVHIRNIRIKLEANKVEGFFIETIRGAGYRLCEAE